MPKPSGSSFDGFEDWSEFDYQIYIELIEKMENDELLSD